MNCPVCLSVYSSTEFSKPLILTCGHTFCKSCICQIFDYRTPRRMDSQGRIHSVDSPKKQCPTCRRKFPDLDVERLSVNYALLEVPTPPIVNSPLTCIKHSNECKIKSVCFVHYKAYCQTEVNGFDFHPCCESVLPIKNKDMLSLSNWLYYEFSKLDEIEKSTYSSYNLRHRDLDNVEKELRSQYDRIIKYLNDSCDSILSEIRQHRKNVDLTKEKMSSFFDNKILPIFKSTDSSIAELNIDQLLQIKQEMNFKIKKMEKIYSQFPIYKNMIYPENSESILSSFKHHLRNHSIFSFLSKRFFFIPDYRGDCMDNKFELYENIGTINYVCADGEYQDFNFWSLYEHNL